MKIKSIEAETNKVQGGEEEGTEVVASRNCLEKKKSFF